MGKIHKELKERKVGKPICLLDVHKQPQTLLADNKEHI